MTDPAQQSMLELRVRELEAQAQELQQMVTHLSGELLKVEQQNRNLRHRIDMLRSRLSSLQEMTATDSDTTEDPAVLLQTVKNVQHRVRQALAFDTPITSVGIEIVEVQDG